MAHKTIPGRLGNGHRSLVAVALLVAVAVSVGLSQPGPVRGAVRTWTGLGLTNNWNEAANWAGLLIPGAADVATFDGTGAKSATINVSINVGGIGITAAYAGSITQAAGSSVTVGAQAFTQAGGTFTGGSSAITVNGPFSLSGGSFAATSATLSISGNFTDGGGTFSAGSGTVALTGGAATIDVPGSETFNNLTVTAGAKTIAAGDSLTVAGSTTLTDGTLNGSGVLHAQGAISQASTFDGGTGTLRIDGSGAQTFTGAATTAAGTLPAVVIDKATGTLTLAGTIRTTNAWTYTAGTVDPGTSTVVFAGNQTISGSQTLNDVVFNGAVTHTVAAGTTLTVSGALALTDGTITTGTVAAQGAISQASTFDGGTGTLRIDGSGAQTFTGAATTAAGTLPAVVIDKATGTLTLAGTIRTTNAWTYTAGTVDPGTSTVVFAGNQTISGSQTLNDVVFNGAVTHTVAAGTTLTVSGALALTDGTITTGTVAAQGAISQASTFDGGTGTLRIDGSGAQTFTGAATTAAGTLPAVVIDKATGTLTLAGTIRTTNAWTYTAGTVDPGTSTVVFAGTLTVTGSQPLANVELRGAVTVPAGTSLNLSGTFTMPSAVVVTLNGTITVAGSTTLTDGTLNGSGVLHAQGAISQASTFDGGTGTLRIDGSGAQTFTGAATTAAGTLPAVVIDKATGTLTLAGTIRTTNAWTYTAGTVDPGTSTVVFAGNQTISGSQTLNDVVFNGAVTHTVAAGTTLTVSGALALTDGTITTGTVAAQGAISQASTFDGGTGTLRIDGSGAQTFTGAATTAAGTLPAVVIDKATGTLTLAGTIRTTNAWTYTAGTVDPGTSTVVFAGNQTISGSQTLNDVVFNGAVTHTVAAGTTLTVSGALALTDGTITTGTVAAQGAISQASTFDGGTGTLRIDGSGAQTFTGAATTAAGTLPAVVIDKATGTLTLAGTIRTTNAWTYTAGTVDPGTSTVVFAGTLTVTSAGMSFYDLRVNGGTSTLGSGLTVDHDLTISAGTLNTSAGSHAITVANDLTIAGTLTANGSLISVAGDISKTGTFTAGTSTMLLNGTAGQTISGTAWTMRNLNIDDAAGVTMATNVSVTGVLNLVTGSLTVGANLLTIANPIAGVPTNLTMGATSSLSIVGTASGIVIPTSVSQLLNLTINDAAGVSLAADLTVNGTLTLTSGPIVTGTDTLVIAPGGTVVRTGGRVAGNLRKTAPVGSPINLTFEIGDLTRYAPAALTFGTVSVTGTVTASTTAGEHPDVANAGIDPAQDVNRYWTLIDAGLAFDVYSATFTFVAADVDAGANPLIFVVAKDDATIWTLPAVGTRTALSTQATGMTNFSDFAIGEPEADLAVTKDDGATTVTAGDGVTYSYVMAVDNSGPSDASGVTLTDTWAAGFNQGTITPSQGTCAPIGAGPDFDCDLGTIAAAASATVTVEFTVPANLAGGPQTNTATVTGDLADPDPSNDTAADTDTVIEAADLMVTKEDGEASVVAGTSGYAYTITATNDGPSDADGVSMTDTVPSRMSAGVPTADLGGDCSGSSGNTIECTLPASLASGLTWTITIPYDVPDSAPPGTAFNTTTVVSDENPTGVTASDATGVVGESDLAVTKDDGETTVDAGDGVVHTYTITVDAGGPSVATGVTIGDTWPAGFSRGTIISSQGTCASIGSGPDFTCALGAVAVGASGTVSVTFTVPGDVAAGPQTNSVTVASDLADPDADNDTASDTDEVVAAPPTPDASQMPDSGTTEPGPIGLVTPLLTSALLLFALGAALLVAGLWEARRRRPPGRRSP